MFYVQHTAHYNVGLSTNKWWNTKSFIYYSEFIGGTHHKTPNML